MFLFCTRTHSRNAHTQSKSAFAHTYHLTYTTKKTTTKRFAHSTNKSICCVFSLYLLASHSRYSQSIKALRTHFMRRKSNYFPAANQNCCKSQNKLDERAIAKYTRTQIKHQHEIFNKILAFLVFMYPFS